MVLNLRRVNIGSISPGKTESPARSIVSSGRDPIYRSVLPGTAVPGSGFFRPCGPGVISLPKLCLGSARGMGATTRRVLHRGQIDHRVLIEEAGRRQGKPAHYAGLYGMILRPRQMMDPEAMPEHNIRVFDRPVFGSPGRQTIVSRRLIHKLACRIALRRSVRRHPQLVLKEAAALSRGAIRMCKRVHC